MRILGIDPGSRRTGVGVVDVQGQRVLHVHHRVIATSDEAFPQRLAEIFEGVRAVIAEFEPGEAAVETVFMARNAWHLNKAVEDWPNLKFSKTREHLE